MRATTVPITLNIRPSGFVGDDDTPIPPTPDLYTQLLQKIAEIQSGVNGKDGLSAYEIAVKNGFVGTVSEWLESLKGSDGLPGKDGINGVQCQCCGKNYRRKTITTGIVWICSTYNTKGKKYCPTAKQIPENTLISVCCEVLGISEFDTDIFENQIEKILVPAPNELTFIFTDGHELSAKWKDRSCSESWTPEMRKANGERSRKWHEKSQ